MAALCAVTGRRSFLALLWSIVVFLSVLGYLVTLGITLQSKFSYDMYYNYNQNNNNQNENQNQNEWNEENTSVSVASRAMLFSYVWTGMSAVALGFAGTMVLGVLTPGGKHYTCFPSKVVQTSPTMIGAFIGSLIMFSNMLFICAILFGQFNVSIFFMLQLRNYNLCEYIFLLNKTMTMMLLRILTSTFLSLIILNYKYYETRFVIIPMEKERNKIEAVQKWNG